jgi:hypothetical protein
MVMSKPCSMPGCTDTVDEQASHVRVGERLFCSSRCAEDWTWQNRALSRAAERFREIVRRPAAARAA